MEKNNYTHYLMALNDILSRYSG